MFESVQGLLDEHDAIQAQLGDPAVYADQKLARKLGRRSAQLNGIVEAYHAWHGIQDDLAAAKEMADEDPEFAAEVPELEESLETAAAKLRRLLIPRDPDDARNVILEVKGGEGGDEAALFAADLLRMYTRYAESRGWKTEMISANESDLGGYKDVQVAIKGSSNDPAEGVYARLKFEGGVHRVQRVPVTESQGRIHTSAAGVLVLPEVDEPEELEINQNDLKIDVYRSSGPGGQSVNTTDSAVRIVHLPTKITVQCQDEKSQHKNKEKAMRVLKARILEKLQSEQHAEESAARKAMVGSGDRSERIRTYNYPQNRVTDHRINLTLYKLDAIVAGDMAPLVDALTAAWQAEALADQDIA